MLLTQQGFVKVFSQMKAFGMTFGRGFTQISFGITVTRIRAHCMLLLSVPFMLHQRQNKSSHCPLLCCVLTFCEEYNVAKGKKSEIATKQHISGDASMANL